MKSKTATKRALLSSAVSLVLCFTMLLGTTFAWFTDSASTGVNSIVSGTLDIQLLAEDGVTSLEGQSLKFYKADNTEQVLWEPGVTYRTQGFQIKNAGNLHLKFQLVVNGITNGNAKLLEVIDFYLVKAADLNNEANWVDLDSFAAEEYHLVPDETYAGGTVYLIGHMQETAGNEYQDLSIDGVGITVYATQMTAEFDSFGDQYDKDSEYKDADKWDGTADTTWYNAAENEFVLTTAEQLAGLAELVNSGTADFSGKTVKLGVNVALQPETSTYALRAAVQYWTPIGLNADSANKFKGTFDGQNYTVYDLYIDNTAEPAYQAAGLFGALNGTLKNLKIDGANINALSSGSATDNGIAVAAGSIYATGSIDNVHVADITVKGNRYVGGIAGYVYGSVTNCSVTNGTLTATPDNLTGSYDNGDKVGGIVGYFASKAVYKISGNKVSDLTMQAYRDLGSIVGCADGADAVTNNSASDITLIGNQKINSYGAKDYNVNEIVGRITAGTLGSGNSFENVEILKDVTVPAPGIVETAANTYEVYSTEGLLNVNDLIAAASTGEGRGIKVKLMTDVDLSGETWKPIDTMWVDFDGNDHTISNLTANAWKAGFFGYVGGGSIKNLTLENVNVTGAQAGAFAGTIEGTIDNCVLKGNNTITWAEKHQFDDPNAAVEAWSGIGAITGVTQPCTINATIAEGATVTLVKTGMTTEADPADNYVGYIGPNKGSVTNKGTVTVVNIVKVSDGLMQNEGESEFYVSNANGLETLNTMMADGSAGKDTVINITENINFTGKTWTPVDSHADTAFSFKELNGNGHTISNMTINGQAMFNRFAGSGDVTIKDITFDNATVNSTALNTSILTVQSYQNVLLDNVDVKDSYIKGGYKVAPLIATVYNESSSTITATLKNCDVSNTTVEATSYDFCTAGMVAFVYADDNDKIEFENCTVSNVKLIAPNDSYKAHAFVYTTGSGSLYNEAEGVTVTNCSFEALK